MLTRPRCAYASYLPDTIAAYERQGDVVPNVIADQATQLMLSMTAERGGESLFGQAARGNLAVADEIVRRALFVACAVARLSMRYGATFNWIDFASTHGLAQVMGRINELEALRRAGGAQSPPLLTDIGGDSVNLITG